MVTSLRKMRFCKDTINYLRTVFAYYIFWDIILFYFVLLYGVTFII